METFKIENGKLGTLVVEVSTDELMGFEILYTTHSPTFLLSVSHDDLLLKSI